MNRSLFLAGSAAAAAGIWLPARGVAAEPGAKSVSPEAALALLMAGNKRFVENELPKENEIEEKRETLVEGQAPFAAILACSDSRVIPNLIFERSLGDLFVARVAGNYPDDLVTASLEYTVEHLGTRLIMVLGHQGCGAVKAVYDAIETKTQLPPHLATFQQLMSPGMAAVVHAHGSQDAAVEANARAAVKALVNSPPVISRGVASGEVRVVGALYHLRSGAVTLLD
ncbi:MAG: carbonic anhydrase [Candidatus Cybelea sp.]